MNDLGKKGSGQPPTLGPPAMTSMEKRTNIYIGMIQDLFNRKGRLTMNRPSLWNYIKQRVCLHTVINYIGRFSGFLKKDGRLQGQESRPTQGLNNSIRVGLQLYNITIFYKLKIFLSICIISRSYLCHIVGINVPKNKPIYDTFFEINMRHYGLFNHIKSLQK
jgi:hypothetical protein